MSQNCYYDLKMCSINIWTGAPWWTGGTPKPFKSLKSSTDSAVSRSNLTPVLIKTTRGDFSASSWFSAPAHQSGFC